VPNSAHGAVKTGLKRPTLSCLRGSSGRHAVQAQFGLAGVRTAEGPSRGVLRRWRVGGACLHSSMETPGGGEESCVMVSDMTTDHPVGAGRPRLGSDQAG